MLQLNNITVRNTLIELNLIVNKGEFVLITGDNGVGKTTLFNTISGSIFPQSGSVIIDGHDVTNVPQHIRASMVSHVLQDPKLGTIGSMTIRENLNVAYKRGKKREFTFSSSSFRDNLYKTKLSLLKMDLEYRLDEYVNVLSGGQKQALSIIMSIISDSKILLFDEITASLDKKTSDNILSIAHKIVGKEKKTCLMVTHNIDHMNYVGKRFILDRGKLCDS